MRLVYLCTCIWLTAAAQDQPAAVRSPAGRPDTNRKQADSEPVKPEERCTVEGSVFNSSTGEPLKKASLVLRRANPTSGSPGMSYAGTSDAAGHFVIEDIEPGRYSLSVERGGFVNQQYGAKTPSSAGTILSLQKSQKLKDANFKLIPQGVITGRVLDEDGEPVQNVNVGAMRSRYIQGKKQWLPMNASNTNDLGEFRLFSLPPGRYLLSAVYRPHGFMGDATAGAAADTYATTYYPDAAGPDAAAQLDVTAGAQLRGVDVHLRKTKSVQIRGRVTNPGSAGSVANATIMLQPKGDLFAGGMARNMSRPYNEKGDFMLNNVPPGSYVLAASVYEDAKTISARVPVEVGSSSIEGLTLQLTAGSDVTGHVKIEGGQAETTITNMRVILQPKALMVYGPGAQGGLVKTDNSFLLTNVSPDVYDLRIFGTPAGGYVKSVRVGEADVTESSVDFTTGVAGGDISIVIAMTAGQITGAVQNEKQEPAAGAAVVLIPEGKRRENDRFYQMASTDQYGNYTLKNVVPGEYRLFAFDNVEYGAYQDPEWLKPFDSKGEKVSVSDGDKQSVQLKLIVTQALE